MENNTKYKEHDFIGVYHNSCSHELCDKMIDYIDFQEKNGFTLTRQENHEGGVNERADTNIIFPSTLETFNYNGDMLNEFFENFQKSYAHYSERNSLGIVGEQKSYVVKIQKTRPAEGYHIWHCEDGSLATARRVCAWVLYLNDDFEAGETEFLFQQKRYKPKKGTLVIFPASFTHIHRGNPPIGGTKYIATGWTEL